jgi:hypothetical protein
MLHVKVIFDGFKMFQTYNMSLVWHIVCLKPPKWHLHWSKSGPRPRSQGQSASDRDQSPTVRASLTKNWDGIRQCNSSTNSGGFQLLAFWTLNCHCHPYLDVWNHRVSPGIRTHEPLAWATWTAKDSSIICSCGTSCTTHVICTCIYI